MEPILDETSVVPCPVRLPSARILELGRTLQSIDVLGARRVLRSVRDAADREFHLGRGLRAWCFDRSTDRDAGRLVAARLSAQPFIDGSDGLFARAEGRRMVQATVGHDQVLGLGLAALNDCVAVALVSEKRPRAALVEVGLSFLDDEGERREEARVLTLACATDVAEHRAEIVGRIDRSVPNGAGLVSRLDELFPRLRLGPAARAQLADLTGMEQVFPQLLRHLRALDEGAQEWPEGDPFRPRGVSFSVESRATLIHGAYGPLRDFPPPEGFNAERWSLHTKLTGGAAARLYYRPVRLPDRALVLIGYFGAHLPTVRFG